MNNAVVYFEPLSNKSTIDKTVVAIDNIFNRIDTSFSKKDMIAIKTHFGEEKNDTHIAPKIINKIVDKLIELNVNPFLTETSTLYAGARDNAIKHLKLAYRHGFTPQNIKAPIIMADGLLGDLEIEVKIDGILNKSVKIARDAVLSDGFVVLSHPTGHIVAGFGACLKNLGMGLSSKKGKLVQHSSIKPKIISRNCINCGMCKKWCPADAIIEKDNKMFILEDKCIGCGECLAVCKYSAVKFNWGVGSVELQKNIAEYALGAIKNKRDKCIFINVLTNMTKECDCMDKKQKPTIPDVGILASNDPVAIDQATLDLTEEANGIDLGKKSYPKLDPNIQLDHAQKIGLGVRQYKLERLK